MEVLRKLKATMETNKSKVNNPFVLPTKVKRTLEQLSDIVDGMLANMTVIENRLTDIELAFVDGPEDDEEEEEFEEYIEPSQKKSKKN